MRAARLWNNGKGEVAMGREVKRVAMDFQWPLKEVWKGYLATSERGPPEGNGWQMWENTSEGSPISPVFEKPEDLARWLVDTKASAFGHQDASYEQWLHMITGTGYAVTAVIGSGGIQSGVAAISDRQEDE